ncbi:unnamed protein product, partial [Onchocerca flexuosa]|uniref:BZIP domain-containing protein n=1 Tax=Onchocerca flexuosa TaxID=387005 RepID=A0A183H880_9BILA
MIADDTDWNNQDDMVLATDSDTGYNPAGMTEVKHHKRHERRRKVKKNSKKAKKRKDIRKRNVKHNESRNVYKKNVRRKKRRRKNIRKKKSVTGAQKRLAEAIGLNLLTGRQKKWGRNERHFPSSSLRQKPLTAPMLSIRNGDDLDIPVETLSLQSTENLNDKTSDDKPGEDTDLITSIMFEQTKTLAPARYQRILRDGTIGENEQMIKQRKKLINEKIVTCKEQVCSNGLKFTGLFYFSNILNASNILNVSQKFWDWGTIIFCTPYFSFVSRAKSREGGVTLNLMLLQCDSDENVSMYSASSSHIEAKEKRKRRPSRWGTPTTSKSYDTIITASIPLPLGPPLTQSTVSLENIPIPSTDQQPTQSQVALLSRPSALNTTPSTSFPLKSASIPSFGMASGQPQISLAPFAGSGLGQQPLGLNQQSLVTLGQQQLTSLGQQTLAGLGQQSVPGLSQPQLASIGQGSLVQMQPSLLPNFFLPPLNLGAMNSLLAAGLLANNNPLAAPPITQPLAQPSSATTAPFMLNPVQLSTASAQQLNQHFVNLATTLRRNVDVAADSSHLSQQPPKQPEGVPPPPPVMKPSESASNNISLCEPLAEKIRKLIEASNVRPMCD